MTLAGGIRKHSLPNERLMTFTLYDGPVPDISEQYN